MAIFEQQLFGKIDAFVGQVISEAESNLFVKHFRKIGNRVVAKRGGIFFANDIADVVVDVI